MTVYLPPTGLAATDRLHLHRRGLGAWHRVRGVERQALPPHLRFWLLDEGSLTAKLRVKSAGKLQVEILRQYRGRPRLSEARRLGIKLRSACVVREVVLRGPNAVPWVFARSIFPVKTVTGRLRHLARLDNRPLGAYLFSHPELTRSPMEVACLPGASREVPAFLQQGKTLWGRRSVFCLHNKKLLVSEIFLPQLVEC